MSTVLVAVQFQQKQQTVSTEFTPVPLFVYGDITRLTQVIGNILNNASKYTPPLGKISIAVQRVNSHVEILVRDNGLGIHPALLPRIFEVFSQADRTLARSEGGLGVGLTVVRHLVELHGGSVTASSEGADRGSQFRILLPLAKEGIVVEQSNLLQLKAEGGLKILVVDDNRDAAAMLTELLSATGNEVVTAYDGIHALTVVEQVHPDVVFLDIGLPEIDGYEVARQMRSNVKLSTIKLIALTGYGQQEDNQKAKAAGFNDHLVKPVDYSKILAILSTIPTKQRR